MPAEQRGLPAVLQLTLELTQYPILASRIRRKMRQELFERGVIQPEVFESEVREKAIQSQQREGLADPYSQENEEVWQQRLSQIRDNLTDFYFAYNLPHRRFEAITREFLAERHLAPDLELTFNPELAPLDALFDQGAIYESYPTERRAPVKHHLEEIRVVLVKAMISDHLDYVGIAKKWLTIADLQEVRRRRIGTGKIGGKAGGLLLAYRILQEAGGEEVGPVHAPPSFFLGADVFYQFMQLNGLEWINQKYKSVDEIREDFPRIQRAYVKGRFPQEIEERLRALLEEVGLAPIIVRSSSLLEDSFNTSFAGKYESHFLPNQKSPAENLEALKIAVGHIFASVYNPDALLYRRQMGLLDYDERMAVLIQLVQGQRYRQYFFPPVAGVGYSRNHFRWHEKFRSEDGFLRMVYGLGTRAVEPDAQDHPRLVALTYPGLRPESGLPQIRRYAQRRADVLDLKDNTFKTLPIREVFQSDHPAAPTLGQTDRGDFLGAVRPGSPDSLVLTFEGLLARSGWPERMKRILHILEQQYGCPVDIEFAATHDPEAPDGFQVHLLQCRPLKPRLAPVAAVLPENVPAADQIFSTSHLVPDGHLKGIRYVIYVDPAGYRALPSTAARMAVARAIGRLNQRLAGECFALAGPGRWGSSNPDLGVKLTYADLYHTRALIEIIIGPVAGEPSYGTHFYQDLVEAGIFSLAVFPEDPGTVFNRAFFLETPNALPELSPADASLASALRVIHVPAASSGRTLELVMNAEADRALAFLTA